jgi:hypothetical protein
MTVSLFAEAVWRLALTAIAIATLATAVVQLLKDLLPVRRWFQRFFLRKWFRDRSVTKSVAPTSAPTKSTAASPVPFEDAERELIRLATGGDYNAFYDLEPAQLCGQMNSAAQAALAYPNRHSALLRFLAPEAKEEDIEIVTGTTDSGAATNLTVAAGQPDDGNAPMDARNRLAHHLQRSIDALQISMSFQWKFVVQILVYIICLGASLVIVYLVNPPARYSLIEVLTITIVAGFLSPVISDLVAVINRLRRP